MDGDAHAAAGGMFGQTKPEGPTQPSSSSLFSGFGPTPASQTPGAVSFPDLQTPQQGTSNIFGAIPSSSGQQNASGLQQPTQNVDSVPSTPLTSPFETLPAMPPKSIGSSAGSAGPSVQYGISSMPVSFISDGDDAPSTLKADVMSIPSSSYDHFTASSSSLQTYSYRPLDIGQNEIRLIKLQAPIKSQPLCGNIIQVPLSAELRYWALSYCWGSLAGKRTIILDEKKLQITVNLDDALRQLGNSYGMLWVDAICINQEDIPERSREVLRMGEIYSLASGVAAWLGVASNTSDRAMDFVQVLATKAPRSQYDEYLKELPSEYDLGKFEDEWTALKDLAKNGYWSRTWIIQELALCRRSKIVHCGTKSLPWDHFENVLGPTSYFSDCILDVTFESDELRVVAAGLENLVVLSDFQRPGFRFIYIRKLLCLTNNFLATDPRDKVYGMLGMSAELRELIPHPNYANSKDVVFRDLTKAMLAAGSNLDLICLKIPTHVVNQSDVVSWVPNWDVHGLWSRSPDSLFQSMREAHISGAYSADAGKDAVISYVGDGSILRVRGFSYDRVDGLGSTETYDWLLVTNEDETKTYDAVEPDHSQNAYGSDVDTFRALNQLSQEIFRVSWNPESKPTELGFSPNYECLIPILYQQRAFMDHDSTRTETALEWLQRTTEFSFVGRSLQEWYEMAYTHGQASPLASSSSVGQMDPELDDMLRCLDRVEINQWRWLSTDRGYLGRTHPQTRKGDEIVIVQGCSVPMVLRPCGEHYKVVCAAYVQGIMNGEALQGVSDDEMQYFDLS